MGILDTGEHNVVAMRFGQFGREEGALITVNSNGALKVSSLVFTSFSAASTPEIKRYMMRDVKR